MTAPKYQHTVWFPEDVEQSWLAYRDSQVSLGEKPESLSAFLIRLIRELGAVKKGA